MRIFITAWLFVGLLTSCATSEEVTRRRGDVEQTGRRISPLAYAWYVRGRHHERLGDLSRAERDYRAALRSDPQSGATWAALGRVTCPDGLEAARRLFDRGLDKADRKAPILMERGLCRIAHAEGSRPQISRACQDLRQAMLLEPEKLASSNAYADCLKSAGKPGESARVRRAARLYLGPIPRPPKAPSLTQVDRALRDDDLTAAQDSALTLMSPGTLAARAALLGKPELAKEQALLVLDASPTDPDASLTMVALQQGDFRSTESLEGLSDIGLLLLHQVLRRHVSRDVHERFLDEYRGRLQQSADPLVEDFLARPEIANGPDAR